MDDGGFFRRETDYVPAPTTTALVRLSQDSGVTGPSERIDYEHVDDALDWVDAQTGHPWDTLTVEPEDGEAFDIDLTVGGLER